MAYYFYVIAAKFQAVVIYRFTQMQNSHILRKIEACTYQVLDQRSTPDIYSKSSQKHTKNF